MKNNIQQISSALEALDEDLKWRYSIDTSFGKQAPVYGYGVQEVSLHSGHAVVTIEAYDRMIHENDESVRGGDTAVFHIDNKKVYSEKEWEQRCKMAEKVNEFTDADRLASLTASETECFVDTNGYDLIIAITPLGEEDGKRMYSATISLWEDYHSDNGVMLQKESFTVDAFGFFSEVNESVINGDMSNQYLKDIVRHRKEFGTQIQEGNQKFIAGLGREFGNTAVMEDRHGFLVDLTLAENAEGFKLKAFCQLDSTRQNTKSWELSSKEQVEETLTMISEGFMTTHYLLESENEVLKNRMAKNNYERGE